MLPIDDETKEKARRIVRDVGHWLWSANDMLAAVHRAREGSILSKGLAAATIASKAISMVFPEQTPRDQLVARGYKLAPVGLGSFFCSRLMSGGPHKTVLLGDEDAARFVFWDAGGEKDAVAAVYVKDRWADGPFLKDGKIEHLATAIEPSTWQGQDLMIGVGRSVLRRDQEETLELVPMKPTGIYLGEPGVDWFVERLKRHGDETRSMLLIGPTGVGKSTLGRLIARNLHNGGRVLKIASQALKRCTAPDVIDLVVTLKPDVLLLDDVSLLAEDSDGYHRLPTSTNDQMLELLEALHGKAKLLIATLMTGGLIRLQSGSSPQKDDESDREGALYFGGMRPGRIDEVIQVKMPSPRVREAILLHYLGGEEASLALGITKVMLKDVVERCEGLTGAYLGEVAHRFKVHGIKNYKSEIQSVKAASPRSIRAGVFRAVKARRSKARRWSASTSEKRKIAREKAATEATEKLAEAISKKLKKTSKPRKPKS